MAILAGDSLLTLAFQVLGNCVSRRSQDAPHRRTGNRFGTVGG